MSEETVSLIIFQSLYECVSRVFLTVIDKASMPPRTLFDDDQNKKTVQTFPLFKDHESQGQATEGGARHKVKTRSRKRRRLTKTKSAKTKSKGRRRSTTLIYLTLPKITVRRRSSKPKISSRKRTSKRRRH